MTWFEDRWYQREAKDAVIRDIAEYNPLIAVPTAGGKTIIMGRFVYDFLEKYPIAEILIVSNTQEILEQNYSAMCKFFPGINIGLYSAGLGSKTIAKVTVAGIQSIYKKPEEFKRFHIMLIDECHTIPFDKKSMYQKFIKKAGIRKYIGMSATIFRRGVGYLHKGENRLFDKLSYDLTSLDSFNRLVTEGYLSKLIARRPDLELEVKGVKTTAGDYNQKQLSEKCDRSEITEAAVSELVCTGKNYSSWLVFAIDIEHCNHIKDNLISHGIEARSLHSKNSDLRKETINDFKEKKFQALVSVGMITTGFDAPNVDLIALLRPTKSPVLHVQMVGRGLRIADGKDHCLVLDFAGNTKRLGPINNVTVPKPKGKKKLNLPPPVKECPVCQCLHMTMVRVCNVCGHVFTFKQKIRTKADDTPIVAETLEKWLKVNSVNYYIHKKQGRPNSLKVVYITPLNAIAEYICLEHGGYAQRLAENWVMFRWKDSMTLPTTVDDLYNNRASLKIPEKILVDTSGKYLNIKDSKFSQENASFSLT
jgi:DNA repair protein RadD